MFFILSFRLGKLRISKEKIGGNVESIERIYILLFYIIL